MKLKSIFALLILQISCLSAWAQTTLNTAGAGVGTSSTGNVGIGTTAPADQLEIVNGNRKIGFNTPIAGTSPGGTISLSRPDDGVKIMYLGGAAAPGDDPVVYGSGGSSELRLVSGGGSSDGFGFYTNISTAQAFGSSRPTPVLKINGSGNMGIGTTTISEKLTVNGKIKCEEVQVVVDVPADYVFDKEYKLSSLSELDHYIQLNKHLPGVPSAQELKTNGWNIGEMNNKLLEKIEELSLYMIELKKENEKMNEEIKALKTQIKN